MPPYKPWMLSAMAPQGELRADEYSAITQRQAAAMRNAVAFEQLEQDRINREDARALDRERMAMTAKKYRSEEEAKARAFERGEERWKADQEKLKEIRGEEKEIRALQRAGLERAKKAAEEKELRRQKQEDYLVQRPIDPEERIGQAEQLRAEHRVGMDPGMGLGLGLISQDRTAPGEEEFMERVPSYIERVTPERPMVRSWEAKKIRESFGGGGGRGGRGGTYSTTSLRDQIRQRTMQDREAQQKRELHALRTREVTIRLDKLQGDADKVRQDEEDRKAFRAALLIKNPEMARQLDQLDKMMKHITPDRFNMLPEKTKNAWLIDAGIMNSDQEWPDEPFKQKRLLMETAKSPKYLAVLDLLTDEFRELDKKIADDDGDVHGEDLNVATKILKELLPSMGKEMTKAQQATFLDGLVKDGGKSVLSHLFPNTYATSDYQDNYNNKQSRELRAGILSVFKIKADTISDPGFWSSLGKLLAQVNEEVIVKPYWHVIVPIATAAVGGGGRSWEETRERSREITEPYREYVERIAQPDVKPGIGVEPRRGMTFDNSQRDAEIAKQLRQGRR